MSLTEVKCNASQITQIDDFNTILILCQLNIASINLVAYMEYMCLFKKNIKILFMK